MSTLIDEKKTRAPEGPFSALIDYDQEAERLEKEKERQQEVEKKIMRTNAIGDAFRLLIDGIGGSAGATINPQQTNPSLLRAAERHRLADTDYKQRLDRLRLQDINASLEDLKYQTGLETMAKKYAFEKDLYETKQQSDYDKMEKKAELDKEVDTHRTEQNIKEANATGRYRTKTEQVIPTMKISDSETGTSVDVDSDTASAMLSELSKNITTLDPQDQSLLRNLLFEGTSKKGQSVQVLLNKYWPKVRHMHPSLESTGAPAMSAEDEQKQAMVGVAINNVLSNTGYNEKKKKRLIKKALQEYDPTMTDDDAEQLALYYIGQSVNQ